MNNKREEDIAALNLVYENSNRFYITTNIEKDRVVVIDKKDDSEVYVFGDREYMIKLYSEYCEIPYQHPRIITKI